MNAISVLDYLTAAGRSPYREWFAALRDPKTKGIIEGRINRLRRGQPGHVRSVGYGVFELKNYFGPGYRIYYLWDGPAVAVLLCGGDKGSQARDISEAKIYAKDYRRRRP